MALAPLYPIAGNPLLSDKFLKLKSSEEKEAQQIMAELLLTLAFSPVYDGDDAERLSFAIVRQINFQLEQGLQPEILKSLNNNRAEGSTTFRDRYVEPGAWAIVCQVTGVQTVGFTVPGPGV